MSSQCRRNVVAIKACRRNQCVPSTTSHKYSIECYIPYMPRMNSNKNASTQYRIHKSKTRFYYISYIFLKQPMRGQLSRFRPVPALLLNLFLSENCLTRRVFFRSKVFFQVSKVFFQASKVFFQTSYILYPVNLMAIQTHTR